MVQQNGAAVPAKMGHTSRDKLEQRWESLKQERASWDSHWKDISEHVLPRAGRFFLTDRNDGKRRHNKIYDNTGTRALRTLAAGMMGGLTSPARPWFRLSTADPDLAKAAPVKLWLSDVTRVMLEIFQKSNTYRALHAMYEELGAFGTAAAVVLPDFNNIIHIYPLTVGEYAIATDFQGNVNTLYREFEMTVAQMVGEFGMENCSKRVRDLHTRGSLDVWVPIVHCIEPRVDRDPTKRDPQNMAWRSVYFEAGCERGKYLRESGFKRFPVIAPRWATSGGDIYGNSPGMESLGDVKQLQHEQLRKAQGIDYKTKPPLQVPTGMKNMEIDTLPGGVSYVDAANPSAGIRTAFEVNLDLSHLLMDIQDVRERIRGAFYADLFLMLANSTSPQMTATEVAERHEEKLLMLGPVLERLQNELLDPLIEITFEAMIEAGVLPEPPQELQGGNINVEFVSMLAQAQRAVGVNSIDRFVSAVGAVAQVKPEVLDKVNADKWADLYGDMLGVDPSLIVPDEEVANIRQQRAQMVAQQQQLAAAQQTANTAKSLSAANMGGDNALTNVIDMFSGYNTP